MTKPLSVVKPPSLLPTGVDALLAQARAEVVVMAAGGTSLRRVDLANLRRGVRYRVLLPDELRSAAPGLAPAQVRTLPHVPMDAVVVDGVAAVLPAERGVAVFRLPSVVRAAVELFERLWPEAVAAFDVSDAPCELSRRERELLTLLFAGSTDESAAARLDVSVRTVRRMVADIMNRLGARSRFQAGAKAADRGWLLQRAG
ncbi:helix-turn-helix transcriptional regulator [Saccharothrix hoggarensis]|uniref:LuxR C-terminal-related transcriptional regulator n=1 Tax=Saccharothrix hoggarensis TaxID=913853 RepID=A0ABW3R107_9PSEU